MVFHTCASRRVSACLWLPLASQLAGAAILLVSTCIQPFFCHSVANQNAIAFITRGQRIAVGDCEGTGSRCQTTPEADYSCFISRVLPGWLAGWLARNGMLSEYVR